MECKHEYVFRDCATDKHAVKLEQCKYCGEIKSVVIRGEEKVAEPLKKLPGTGEKITRMSVIKAAVDIISICKGPEVLKVDNVLMVTKNISEDLENWVNRAT